MKIDQKILDDLQRAESNVCHARDSLVAICDDTNPGYDALEAAFNCYADLDSSVSTINKIFFELCRLNQNKQDTTDTVKVIREDDPKVLELLNSDDWCEREVVAKLGLRLDKLMNDTDRDVRKAVARQGYGLDKLVNDNYWGVRVAVAEQGYGLDKLVNDTDRNVRKAVAQQGYGLEKLKNDEDEYVREAAKKKLAELEAGESCED